MLSISDYASTHTSLVQFGIWASTGVLVITIALIVYILLLRVWQINNSSRLLKFHRVWRPLLAQATFELPEHLPTLAQRDHIALLSLWNHYYKLLKGDSTDNLIHLAERVRLAQIARQQLFHPEKQRKLLAIMTLGNLRSREDWPLLNKFLHFEDTYISLVAIRACFNIHPERAAQTLLPYLITRNDYPPAQVGGLLKNLDHVIICPLLQLHMKLNLNNNSTTLLRYMQLCSCNIDKTVLKTILDRQMDDQVISTALGMINDHKSLELILPFVEHPRWHVRVHVAAALGKIAHREQLPYLLKLLQDSQWWVRYRAAQAITKLPFLNALELDEISRNLNDKYAQEIFQQAMAELK